MSSLYSIVNTEKSIEKGVLISISATNHEEQKIPDQLKFYFAVIGSIYWQLSKHHQSFGFGIHITEYLNKQEVDFKIPVLEEYIGYMDESIDYGTIDYSGIFDYEDFESIATQFISIEITKQKRNQYKCLEAEVIITSKEEKFLDIVNIVKKIDIMFDEYYLE